MTVSKRSPLLWRAGIAVALLALALLGWWLQRPAGLAGGGATAASAPASGAGAGAGGGPSGAGRGAAGGPGGPPAVEAAAVGVRTLEDTVQAVGTVRSVRSVMIRPEAGGRVKALGFSDGSSVARGALLLQLDDAVPAAQLKQAQAQWRIAETNLKRSQELAGRGFVSPAAVDQNAAALEVAAAQVALARAQVGRLRTVAPFSGVAGLRLVQVGDFVREGQDIVQLEDPSALMVDFRLPEAEAARIRTGQRVHLSADAVPGLEALATIEAVDAQVDANGRALLVRARIGPGARGLRSGSFARVKVVMAVREGARVVPEEALVPLPNGAFAVYKLVPGGDKGFVAQRVPVQVGMRQPGMAEIIGPLNAGDRVVTAGQARLGRGDAQPVRIVQVGPASAAASGSAPSPASGAAPAAPPPASGAAALPRAAAVASAARAG